MKASLTGLTTQTAACARADEPGALLTSIPEVCAHAVILAKQGIRIEPEDPNQGRVRSVRVTTLCIHGDHPGAARRAAAVRNALQENGIPVERL